MSFSIVRMYDTPKRARDAVSKLAEEGFEGEAVVLVTPEADDASAALAAALEHGHSLGDARVAMLADALGRGRSVVLVRAPFGRGQLVTQVLESCDPVDTELLKAAREKEAAQANWGRGTPFSRMLGMAVLVHGKPAPLSDALGLPVLSRGRSFLAAMFGEIGDPHFSFSSALGFGLLSRNPAPLSSALGMKTVSEPRRPWDSSFGMALLSDNPAPLSSALGLSVLSDNAAPLSSALGMSTLSNKRPQ